MGPIGRRTVPGSRRRGQAATEFAIAFPVQIFITLGVFQLALCFVGRMFVEYASFTAARAALVGEDPRRAAEQVLAGVSGWTGSGAVPRETLRYPDWGLLPGSGFATEKTEVDVLLGARPGDPRVEVEVRHHFELIVPVVNRLATLFTWRDEADFTDNERFGQPHLLMTSRHGMEKPWQ